MTQISQTLPVSYQEVDLMLSQAPQLKYSRNKSEKIQSERSFIPAKPQTRLDSGYESSLYWALIQHMQELNKHDYSCLLLFIRVARKPISCRSSCLFLSLFQAQWLQQHDLETRNRFRHPQHHPCPAQQSRQTTREESHGEQRHPIHEPPSPTGLCRQ